MGLFVHKQPDLCVLLCWISLHDVCQKECMWETTQNPVWFVLINPSEWKGTLNPFLFIELSLLLVLASTWGLQGIQKKQLFDLKSNIPSFDSLTAFNSNSPLPVYLRRWTAATLLHLYCCTVLVTWYVLWRPHAPLAWPRSKGSICSEKLLKTAEPISCRLLVGCSTADLLH